MSVCSVGLDVSAQHLDVARDGTRAAHRFANTAAGRQRLLGWLAQQGGPPQVQVGLEATGTYHLPIAMALHAAGYTLRVCNPLQVRRYQQALLHRTKTDAVDAQALAQFCARHPELPAWQPASPAQQRLQTLVRTRAALREQRQQLLHRQTAAAYTEQADLVRQLQAPVLAALTHQLAQIEQELATLAQQDDATGQHLRWLQSIPGVGLLTAAVLLAEIPFARLTAGNTSPPTPACVPVTSSPAVPCTGSRVSGATARRRSARPCTCLRSWRGAGTPSSSR
jgi:transposase